MSLSVKILARGFREAKALAERYDLPPGKWIPVQRGGDLQGAMSGRKIIVEDGWHLETGERNQREINHFLVRAAQLGADIERVTL